MTTRSHLAAEILFLIWFAFLYFMSTSCIVFAQSGPRVALGVTILVQGVLHLIIHFRREAFMKTKKGLINRMKKLWHQSKSWR